jgi:hypothetical protein
MAQSCGIPDMRFINRQVPIVDVARKLDLLLEGSSMIHCWHPEHHQHGDRTASVGIRASNNTVKCFGCDSRPMGPVDLVMDVHGMASPADAALWIALTLSKPRPAARRRGALGVGQAHFYEKPVEEAACCSWAARNGFRYRANADRNRLVLTGPFYVVDDNNVQGFLCAP